MGSAGWCLQLSTLQGSVAPWKHGRDSWDHLPVHKHNHPASSERSLWEGQEYEKESVAINKFQVLLAEAVFTEHRVTLTLGTHILASPSLCDSSR